jgi:phenylalanyl-tRNA synthetase beta chain
MKYSYNWIQKHIEETLPSPDALKEQIIFHAFEVEDVEEKNGDSIFDIKVLPDRAGDCLSHYGMAREIAGLLKLTLKTTTAPAFPNTALALPLEIKSELCRRYMAIQIDGVKVGPSPAWLKDALEAVGQRSINNIVDATNYILFDTGQPTHAFDTSKIDGGITVRLANENESIITLSEETKTLKGDMLVIADYVGAVAIAGVKGGKTAEVDDKTSSVILEIANFDAASVRKTARALGLPTDAAKRFENNFSPEVAGSAAAQLVALVLDIAGGEVKGVKDLYPEVQEKRTLSFTVADITRLLGSSVTEQTIKDVFDAYHYIYSVVDGVFSLEIPFWRADISGAHDIVEEIGRVIGYDSIAPEVLPFTPTIEANDVFEKIQKIKTYLTTQGYSEVMTYTFRKKGDVYVAYGAKDKSALRTNLSDGLKESYEQNRLNAPLLGMKTVKQFEIGTVFSATTEAIHIATMDNGTIQELTLDAFYAQHEAELNDSVVRTQPAAPVPFKLWSAYPYMVRDIAVWVADDAGKAILATLAKEFSEQYCVQPAYIFDQFTKDGRESIGYRFIFQSFEKTLTEGEVNEWFAVLTDKIVAEKTFELR